MNDWQQMQALVLDKLDQHAEYHKEHAQRLTELQVSVAELKVRAGFMGALTGMISSLLVAIGLWFKK